MDNQTTILKQFQADLNIMEILTIIRSLNLKDSWLAAGSVRNFIWNRLSGKSGFDAETDVDVIFYDPAVSYEETVALEQKLRDAYPQYRWELKNQVYMHSHSPGTWPYVDSCDTMSKYPERCTAIGLRLLDDEQLELFAPYGLEDILAFRIQPTPHFAKNPKRMQLYQQRLRKKDWTAKWPQLQIVL